MNDIYAPRLEKIFSKIKFGYIGINMKEMYSFSILKISYSQGPYFVLHLHCKCTHNWSFNCELGTVIQAEINSSWSLIKIFVNRFNI